MFCPYYFFDSHADPIKCSIFHIVSLIGFSSATSQHLSSTLYQLHICYLKLFHTTPSTGVSTGIFTACAAITLLTIDCFYCVWISISISVGVKDVTPTTTRPWTAKVTITEKSSAREARSSSIKFQNMVLADSENNRVHLTLFGEGINMFKDRLKLYATCYISNAIVKPALRQYQTWGNLFQWSLHSTSLVEEAIADEAPLQFLSYDFLSIEKLLNHKNSSDPINMLFIALQILPQKNVSIRATAASLREIIVTDKSLKPLVLTLWDHFVKNEASDLASVIDQKPILAAIRVKVVPYDGLLLGRGVQVLS